jgi:hypothetical protein
VLFILSVLGLVNVTTVQARVHYALTQTANTVAMYSYVLEVLGIAGVMIESEEKSEELRGEAKAAQDNINSILNGIMDLDMGGIPTGAENITGDFGRWMENPLEIVQLFLNYGVSTLKDWMFEQMIRPLMDRYLTVYIPGARMSGHQYLSNSSVVGGINGLRFNDGFLQGLFNEGRRSVLIDQDGSITIYVNYDIDYFWGILPLQFTQLSVTQSVSTGAWLGGRGDVFKHE